MPHAQLHQSCCLIGTGVEKDGQCIFVFVELGAPDDPQVLQMQVAHLVLRNQHVALDLCNVLQGHKG